MAGWWMPKGQLKILRQMSTGDTLWMDSKGKFFLGEDNVNCTASARALLNKSYITAKGAELYGRTMMDITQTGKNEMGYNRHQQI